MRGVVGTLMCTGTGLLDGVPPRSSANNVCVLLCAWLCAVLCFRPCCNVSASLHTWWHEVRSLQLVMMYMLGTAFSYNEECLPCA